MLLESVIKDPMCVVCGGVSMHGQWVTCLS